MTYLPPTTHVTLLATLRRERLLPAPGEVVVQAGQRVSATDIVATTILADHHCLRDVARELGVPPAKVDKYLVKHDGEEVKRGEALAVRRGLFGLTSQTVPSPASGQIILTTEGKILLAAYAKPIELRAGLPGLVNNIIPDYGVEIETTGALVEGVWGNGRDVFAVMRVLTAQPAEELTSEMVDVGLRDMVVAAGVLHDAAVLARLASVQVRGLVLGSAPVALLPALQKAAIPVMLTDRLGPQGFSEPVYTLLSSNSGREVWLNAQPTDRYRGRMAELLLPLPTPGNPPPPPVDGEVLHEGSRVRITRGPEAGQVGQVLALSDQRVALPNGLRAYVAAVEIEQAAGQPVTVPFANLEILE